MIVVHEYPKLFKLLYFSMMWLISVCLQGHELTLRVLYRLFGEAEEDRDFFISTTARSVYEAFLLQVVGIYVSSFILFIAKVMGIAFSYLLLFLNTGRNTSGFFSSF